MPEPVADRSREPQPDAVLERRNVPTASTSVCPTHTTKGHNLLKLILIHCGRRPQIAMTLRHMRTCLLGATLIGVGVGGTYSDAYSADSRLLERTVSTLQHDDVTQRRGGQIPETIELDPGDFVMGDGVALCAQTIRNVTLTRGFRMGKQEVTNAEYLDALQWAFDEGLLDVREDAVYDGLGAGDFLLDLETPLTEFTFADGIFALREAPFAVTFAYPEGYDPTFHPVKRISWKGAAAYCDWLNLREGLPLSYDHTTWDCNGGDPYGAVGFRLPTDAEWEYAASFDDDRVHPWGDEPADCSRANFIPNGSACRNWTEPVGLRPAGNHPLGFQDLSGNVGEWCNDWHDCPLPEGDVIDPVGPADAEKKVLHGGGFFYGNVYMRCSNRDADPPDLPLQAAGFRIAQTRNAPTDVSDDTGVSEHELRFEFPFSVSENPVQSGTLRLNRRWNTAVGHPSNPRRSESIGDPALPSELGGRLLILDVEGRRRFRADVEGDDLEIDVDSWPSGLYWIRWTSHSGHVVTRPITILR